MPTYTALTTLSDKTSAEALAEALEGLSPEPTGVGAFEIEDGSNLWEVGAYFEEAPDRAGLALLATIHQARAFAVSQLPEVDWVAHVRRELAPVTAGRFFLYGSHDAENVPVDAVPLLIEASMAFGTGHHGTTQGCLRALDRLAAESPAPGAVLDLGCGTAVLAMAAARVWPGAQVMAGDFDPVAVDVAQTNIDANRLTGRVKLVQAKGLNHSDLAYAVPFDLIFANILKAPLIDLAPEITAALAPGGVVILSGLLNEQAGEVAQVYACSGNNLRAREEIGDWTTLVFCKNG